jgi:hypothetical protein
MPKFSRAGWSKVNSNALNSKGDANDINKSSGLEAEQPSSAPGDYTRPLTDSEYQLAVQQQQSVYQQAKTVGPTLPSNIPALATSSISKAPTVGNGKDKKITVKRSGGGKTWEDPSLLEWDPSHFRLFVGNLSGEVTDEMLVNVFGKFPSMSKVKVVMDPATKRAKGFGFVAFKDPDDYFKAFKEVNGKYIGNHPVQLRKATTEIKKTVVKAAPYDKNRRK